MRDEDRGARLLRLARLRQEVAQLEQALEMADAAPAGGGVPGQSVTDAFALLDEHAGDLLSIHNAAGDYVYASPTAASLFGWPPEQLVGTNAYAYFHPDDLARIASSHASHADDERADGGEHDRVRYRLRCADDSFRWVETVSRAHRDGERVQHIVCITRDVHDEHTARLRAESMHEELVRAHHHAFSRKLADALAHELNNPLASAMSAADLARSGKTAMLDTLADSLERIRDVVRELTLLASLSGAKEVVDVARLVRRVVELMDVAAYDPRLDLAVAQVYAEPSRLYHLVYSMLLLHTRATDDAAAARLTIACGPAPGGVRIAVSSLTATLERQVRKDLLGALRGTSLDADIPIQLARAICEDDLGGEWIAQMDSGALRTEAVLPDK